MKLIWVLLAVVYTKSMGVINRKTVRLISDNTTSKFEQNKSVLYSVSEHNSDGVIKNIKTTVFPLKFKRNSSPQNNIESAFISKPSHSTIFSRKLKTNLWLYSTPRKLFSKLIESTSKYKNIKTEWLKKNSLDSEKGLFEINQQNYMTSIDTNSTHYNIEKNVDNSTFETPKKQDVMKLINTTMMENQLPGTRTPLGNIEFLAQEEITKKELESISTKSYQKSQRFISQVLQAITINETEEEKKLIHKAQKINKTITNSVENPIYNVLNATKSTKNGPSGTYDVRFVPKYEPEKSVFVNPDLSEIISDYPSKEIDLKTLKNFKPLVPDYEYILSRKPGAIDEDFDWYQTDELFGLLSGSSTSKSEFNENITEVQSTAPASSDILHTSPQGGVSITDDRDVKKQIIVLGVQQTPYASYENQFTTNSLWELPKTEKIGSITTNKPIQASNNLINNKVAFERQWNERQQITTSLKDDNIALTHRFTKTNVRHWKIWDNSKNLKFRELLPNIDNQDYLSPITEGGLVGEEEVKWPLWQLFVPNDFTDLTESTPTPDQPFISNELEFPIKTKIYNQHQSTGRFELWPIWYDADPSESESERKPIKPLTRWNASFRRRLNFTNSKLLSTKDFDKSISDTTHSNRIYTHHQSDGRFELWPISYDADPTDSERQRKPIKPLTKWNVSLKRRLNSNLLSTKDLVKSVSYTTLPTKSHLLSTNDFAESVSYTTLSTKSHFFTTKDLVESISDTAHSNRISPSKIQRIWTYAVPASKQKFIKWRKSTCPISTSYAISTLKKAPRILGEFTASSELKHPLGISVSFMTLDSSSFVKRILLPSTPNWRFDLISGIKRKLHKSTDSSKPTTSTSGTGTIETRPGDKDKNYKEPNENPGKRKCKKRKKKSSSEQPLPSCTFIIVSLLLSVASNCNNIK